MIEIHNLTKYFDNIKAVDEVSVAIREKTVFGLIGTNGAGKSTVLRMLSGVLKPDGETVFHCRRAVLFRKRQCGHHGALLQRCF